jgi:hypothetical protein
MLDVQSVGARGVTSDGATPAMFWSIHLVMRLLKVSEKFIIPPR